MAETTFPPSGHGTTPETARGFGRLWGRISPRLVPLLAVLTALLLTIPLMVLTGGRGDVGRGLNIAGTAYSALIEGSLGVVINDVLSRDDFAEITAFSQSGDLTQSELRLLGRAVGDLSTVGVENARQWTTVFERFRDLDDETLEGLGGSIFDLQSIDAGVLNSLRPLIAELEALPRGDVRALAEDYAAMDSLSADDRAALEALVPSAADYDDGALLAAMQLVNEEGIVKLDRLVGALDTLEAENLTMDSGEAQDLAAISSSGVDIGAARTASETITRIDAAGIVNLANLQEQIAIIRNLYEQNLLTNNDVVEAVNTELDSATVDNLLVRRPGNRLIVARESSPFGLTWTNNNTPDDPADDKPEAAYLRLGGSALLFFPGNLETMLVRAIPFIIAGLAVALGFKAGLFNIGAEGQLYAGGIAAVWVGFSPIFAGLPIFIHLPLMIVMGIFGGFLWGLIPGALKAYTGAHEVIVTIMLNYVAILSVDWLIKSTNPVILLDVNASTPRTPFIMPTATMPRFVEISPWIFIIAGVLVALYGLYRRRAELSGDIRFAMRPIINGLLVAVGGLFLIWINVRGSLHIGFILMILTVRFVDWFLNRTTPGFELRTVGSNPNAARYAGMNVKLNIMLAMALTGALAGLAGAIEISAVQYNMQPAFFSGLGFDAIAVALLARSNPRNMIVAGLVWGSLLAGAGLMQVRANISIDLVKIIQALIIMFIAADAIIRFVWRVPKPAEKTATTTFSKGWGG